MKKLSFLLTLACTTLFAYAQQFDFALQFGGTQFSHCIAMERDPAGHIYIGGYFGDSMDLDPTSGTQNVTSLGEQDVFVVKLDTNGTVMWAKAFGGVTYDILYSLCLDPSGNVVLTGSFGGSIDVDPGPDEYNLESNGADDFFVVKLSGDGELMWGVSAGGIGQDYSYSVICDQSGNVIVGGMFTNMVDFDPSSATENLVATDYPDAFIWKLSGEGNYLWATSFSGSLEDRVADLAVDAAGRITAVGTFYEVADFDPDGEGFSLTSLGLADLFVAQLEADGTFVTAKKIGGFGSEVPSAIEIGIDGALYFTGYYQLTVDFDPDAGIEQLTAQGPYEIFVAKWNSDGSYAWARGFAGDGYYNSGVDITLDPQNNVLTTGYFSASTDFDPGEGIAQIGNEGNADIFISKLSNEGNYIWAYGIGASQDDWGNGICTDNEGGIYVAGYFDETVDFNPGAGSFPMTATGFDSSFLLKISEDECSNLSLGIISAHSTDCVDFHGQAIARATGGVAPYTYEWAGITPLNDTTITPLDEGIYYVTVTDNIGCERTTGAFVNGYDNPSFFNLEAYIAEGQFRPEINSHVNVVAFNHGCEAVDATVKLLLTPNSTFLSADPEPTQIVGDTIMWLLPAINWDSDHFLAQVHMIPDTDIPLYDSLCFKVWITPYEGDLDTNDNSDNVCYFFHFSYDPNEKQVSPAGVCDEGYTLMGEQLHYNVHFQNIGNAPAENVYILDTLSEALDLNTFHVLAASHDMVTEILPGNVIRYRFDNINLPDSTSDFEGSQGFVFFSIDPVDFLFEGTEVKNSAAIYFDQNDAVITNETRNTYVVQIPECGNAVTASPVNTSSLLLYPNPASGTLNIHVAEEILEIRIINELGRVIYHSRKTRNTDVQINTSSFSGGMYFVQVWFKDGVKTARFVVAAK